MSADPHRSSVWHPTLHQRLAVLSNLTFFPCLHSHLGPSLGPDARSSPRSGRGRGQSEPSPREAPATGDGKHDTYMAYLPAQTRLGDRCNAMRHVGELDALHITAHSSGVAKNEQFFTPRYSYLILSHPILSQPSQAFSGDR